MLGKKIAASMCTLVATTGCYLNPGDLEFVESDFREYSAFLSAPATTLPTHWQLLAVSSGEGIATLLRTVEQPAPDRDERVLDTYGEAVKPVSASFGNDGSVAFAWDNGMLTINSIDTLDEVRAERALPSRGLAWSNDGGALAVVSQVDGEVNRVVVRIMDRQLDDMAQFPVSLPTDGTLPFVVSWSPNDEMVAISTNVVATTSVASQTPQCAVVDTSGNVIATARYANVYYVGEREFVGVDALNENDSRSRVVRLTRVGQTFTPGARVSAAVYVVASDPVAGTYLVLERNNVLYPAAFSSLAVRQGDLREPVPAAGFQDNQDLFDLD